MTVRSDLVAEAESALTGSHRRDVGWLQNLIRRMVAELKAADRERVRGSVDFDVVADGRRGAPGGYMGGNGSAR